MVSEVCTNSDIIVGKFPREKSEDFLKIKGESVDYSKSLNGSSYTAGWVLDSLRRNDEVYKKDFGSRKVKDITSYDVSGGKGFVSIILKCTVIFEDSANENDVYTTILKIPGLDSINENNSKGDKLIDVDKLAFKMTVFHEFECDFYKNLAPLLEVPVPKVFKIVSWILKKQEGCIHMEDLSRRGKVMTFYDSFNFTQLKGIVKHIAHMHKQFLVMKKENWKGKYLKNQDAFVEMAEMIKKTIANFKKITENKYQKIDSLIDKYENFCSNPDFIRYAFTESYKHVNVEPVFVHGDMWTSNIMIAVNEDGDFTNDVAAFVDWQICHEGSPMDDLARVLTVCTDGNIRREAEPQLLKFYLDTLTSELSSEGIKVPYTLDALQEAYDYMFMVEAIHPLFMTVFIGRTLKQEPGLEMINESKTDKAIIRAIHALEDLDRLLSGKYKHVFEKYGK